MSKAQDEIITLLKAKLTDPNSVGRTGGNWIYPDRPRNDLARTSYPRISVCRGGGNLSDHLGAGNTSSIDQVGLEIMVYAAKDHLLTYGGSAKEGTVLGLAILEDCDKNIKLYWRDYDLVNYVRTSINDLGFRRPAGGEGVYMCMMNCTIMVINDNS